MDDIQSNGLLYDVLGLMFSILRKKNNKFHRETSKLRQKTARIWRTMQLLKKGNLQFSFFSPPPPKFRNMGKYTHKEQCLINLV